MRKQKDVRHKDGEVVGHAWGYDRVRGFIEERLPKSMRPE